MTPTRPGALEGLPIAITGASSGIGRATALACARAGMPVALAARRADKLEATAAEIDRAGGRAIVVPTDVTDPEACERLVARTVEDFGSIHAVFANAGYGIEAPAHEIGAERTRAMFETNFYGTMNVVEPAVRRMLDRGRGHVLMCSSCVAKMSLPYFGAYCATKAAQNLVGRAMNLELRPHGVRCSTVHPVGTKTEFFDTARALSDGDGQSLEDHAPEFFMQRADTVAKAIVKCLRRPKPEVWPSWSRFVRLSMAICVAFPALGDLGVRRLVNDWERAARDRQPAGS